MMRTRSLDIFLTFQAITYANVLKSLWKKHGPGKVDQISFPTFLRLDMKPKAKAEVAARTGVATYRNVGTPPRHDKDQGEHPSPPSPRSNPVWRDWAAENPSSDIDVSRGALERVQHDVTRENDGPSGSADYV